MTSWIRDHPVLAYYVLAFATSWAAILLVIGGPAAGLPLRRSKA